MPGVESALSTADADEWDAAHAHGPTMAEQRTAVAEFIAAGVTPEMAAQVSDEAVTAVYDDLVKAGIV